MDARGGEPTAVAPLRVATAAGRWVIVATVLGSGIAALDATVVGIALPAIGREFSAGVDSLQWTVNGYTVMLAGLLLLGGGLGDRFGRRRVFLIGVIWFAVSSLLCGLAPSTPLLIAARALQGVGGALLVPGSLAILGASFAEGDRSRAIGAWSGLGGLATAIGPFLGGYLIHSVSWRLIFFINLPLALAVVLITARHVPESRDSTASALDVGGAALAAVGLAGVSYGLTEGPARGWGSYLELVVLGAGVLALGLFVLVEARSSAPLLPLSVFRSGQFTAANAVTFVVYAALGGALFLVPVVLQEAAGYGPLRAGIALLPITVVMLLLSARSAALAARIGPRLQMSVGPVIVAAGMALFTRVSVGGNYLVEVLPAVAVLALGLAATVAPLTATALGAVRTEQSGLASAVNNTIARVGSLLAVAILPVAAGITGTSYRQPVRLLGGFHTAVLLAAAACALGGLLAAVTIRNAPRGSRRQACRNLHCELDGPSLRCEQRLADTADRRSGPSALPATAPATESRRMRGYS